MAVGHKLPLPEEADSWGEFHARLEMERMQEQGLPVVWQIAAALSFIVGLVCIAYALQGGRTWLWPCALAALAVPGVMAARALTKLEEAGERAGQLDLMERAWEEHLERHSPSR